MNISLRAYWQLLATHIKAQKTLFFLLVILLFSSIGLQVVNPQIIRSFIDAVIAGESSQVITRSAWAFIIIALVQQFTGVTTTYLGENVAWKATNALRSQLVRHCLNLDMGFHNEIRPGELIQRIDGDVAQLSTFFSQLVIRVAGNLLLLFGIIIALSFENWLIGLTFAIFSLITLWALNRLRTIAVEYRIALRQAEADLYGFIEEQLNGREDIRASGAIPYVLQGLFRLQAKIFQHDTKSSQKNWLIGLVSGILLMLGNVLAVSAGFFMHASGRMSIGTVYLLIHYINLVSGPIRELTRQLENMQTVGASVQRLQELSQRTSLLYNGPNRCASTGAIQLCFKDVSFAYEAEQPVLHHVSFQLSPGQVLGLLGRTGSGKTTIARLVFRLYDTQTGQILINGHDLRQFHLQSLRQHIGLVTQDVQLFRGTLRDNITLFDDSISNQRIIEAIEELQLMDWFISLSHGLE
ncbi:MAG: ABC transporter ATP-binding protein, partial [Anaerolineae bacterium]|nr:ABC transporter ATP-binding protein [Anaerolineae bacterium]